MVLQETVKLIFGANLQETHLPDSLQGGWTIGQLTIPVYRVFILGITLLCLLAVYVWFYHTSFGLKIRAVVQNRNMASAMGISTRRVDSMTFAFATGLAGVAGCILAHLYNIKYNMGADYIVEAFMVVILGGMGQLSGTVAGGVVIGTGNSFVAKLLSTGWVADLAIGLGVSRENWDRIIGNSSEIVAKILVLVMVIAFILARPSGLFASKERTYD